MMEYFDTDVLVHFVVKQDPQKHKLAQSLISQSAKKNQFVISYLSLNEFAFVLAKLGVEQKVINNNLDVFASTEPCQLDKGIFKRAREIANKIGHKHFSDCIHTATAEHLGANLITANKKDFKKIEQITDIKITII